jgi:type I restriction enzyme, S subunit
MKDLVQFPKAFEVSFKELERWSVAFYHKVQWKWPDEVMNTLDSCLLRVRVPVDCSPEGAPIIEKITFGGELSILSEGERKDYKGKLFRANSGQLIYSKIRVKQGSVCIVPSSFEWVAVSSEYPTYSLDRSRIDAAYLELVLRSSAFKHYLDGLSHGGSTKTRIAPDEFEALRIPIPPLLIQQVIKNHWRKMNQEYFGKQEQIQLLENQCQGLVQEHLDINIPPPRKIGKLFLLHLAKAERWSFEYNKRVLSGLAQIQTGKYKSYPMGDLCKGQSGSTPSKKNRSFWENGEIPWVSPKDMKTRYISDSQDHISRNAIEYNASPVVKKGSILIVVRSGILQRKVPVAMTQIDVSINQDIRSFTPRTDDILPEFLLAYFEAKQWTAPLIVDS